MIHLMKKMSAQIVIRVMVEVGVWNFGIHLFQMKIQNDYKIIKVQQRNLRCLWIRKLMKLRVCWYYAGRLSLILKIVNRILSAVYIPFRRFRAPKSGNSEQAFPLYSAIAYNESMHIKLCKFITGGR